MVGSAHPTFLSSKIMVDRNSWAILILPTDFFILLKPGIIIPATARAGGDTLFAIAERKQKGAGPPTVSPGEGVKI